MREEIIKKFEEVFDEQGMPTRDYFVLASGFSKRQIDEAFGNYSALKEVFKFKKIGMYDMDDFKWPETPLKSPTKEKEGDSGGKTVEALKTAVFEGDVRTLEDLIQFANVDLEKWEVVKYSASSYSGKSSVKADFKSRQEENDSKSLFDFYVEESLKHSPKKFCFPSNIFNKERLLVLNPSDFHFNKYCSKEQNGTEDYNLNLSVRIFNETIENLINKSVSYSNFNKILFIVGNDLLNSDYISGGTTAHTPQDNDVDWFKAYTTVCKVITETIEKLASLAAVDVVICLGNHSTHSCFTLGEYLTAWFRNNENVKIVNDPRTRKFYRYGQNAFLLTHGNNEKISDLPIIFATECDFWGECKNREVWMHHFHQQKLTETHGVITRIFPSLSGTDKFHFDKGFTSNRRVAQALIYDEDGLDAILEYRPSLI